MSESEPNTPTKEDMDDAFGETNEPTSFSEGVLAERRGSNGQRTPQEGTITFEGNEYTITYIEPPASEIKVISEKGEDLTLDELEGAVDDYLIDPSLEDVEGELTLGEYQIFLMQVIQCLAGIGDDFANQVAEEVAGRSDGSEGN